MLRASTNRILAIAFAIVASAVAVVVMVRCVHEGRPGLFVAAVVLLLVNLISAAIAWRSHRG